MSLIEAGAAGIPAVTTTVGGVTDVVTSSSGALVDPDDEDAYASALVRLARDDDLRRNLGAVARRQTLSRFHVDRLIGDVDALYTELMKQRP